MGLFHRFAASAAEVVGSAYAFTAAVVLLVGWLILGPLFHYSDAWQLLINTATTIITFLMVFLIQNAQNRDNRAIQLKLDELIRASDSARNSMLDLDRLSDQQLRALERQYQRLCETPDHEAAAEVAAPQPVRPRLG